MGQAGSALAQIFNTIAGLYLLFVVARFLLQLAKADFYNPISQAVFKATDPVVRVFKSFIPGYRGVDFLSLILFYRPVPCHFNDPSRGRYSICRFHYYLEFYRSIKLHYLVLLLCSHSVYRDVIITCFLAI